MLGGKTPERRLRASGLSIVDFEWVNTISELLPKTFTSDIFWSKPLVVNLLKDIIPSKRNQSTDFLSKCIDWFLWLEYWSGTGLRKIIVTSLCANIKYLMSATRLLILAESLRYERKA